jgi:hypothetical protein
MVMVVKVQQLFPDINDNMNIGQRTDPVFLGVMTSRRAWLESQKGFVNIFCQFDCQICGLQKLLGYVLVLSVVIIFNEHFVVSVKLSEFFFPY